MKTASGNIQPACSLCEELWKLQVGTYSQSDGPPFGHPNAFVLSRLDYCNSLLSGCPKHLLEKLQKVQNSAARLVLKAHKRDHVSPLLRILHWLPIQAHIEYKLSTLSLLFLWYSPCLSVWPSLCLLSIKTAPLLIWLKNSTHSAHKDQNIWTEFIFPCCSFYLEFSASWHKPYSVSHCM